MKYACFVTLLLLTVFQACLAQKKTQSTVYSDQQWEYLVLSFGKTTFEPPEKALAYKSIGLGNPNEASSLQNNLDILGRFGWELIAVVGAIGGDQQLMLKRKYDKARTANEYGMIQTGRELYLKDLTDIIGRSLKLSEEQSRLEKEQANKPRLIDLDEVARLERRESLRRRMHDAYRKKLDQVGITQNATIDLQYKSAYSSDITIDIAYDLTPKFLLDGNKYRGQEVQAHLKSTIESFRFRYPELSKYDGISIQIRGFILFAGSNVFINTATNRQSYDGSDWYGD